MKLLIILPAVLALAMATPHKRLGVPVSAEIACENPETEFAADEQDCQVFYICDHGWPKIRRCPSDTIWTPFTGKCESKFNATNDECGYIPPPPPPDALFFTGFEDTEIVNVPEWLCADGEQLIAYRGVCDGVPQCEDESDERNCAEACNQQICQLPDCWCASSLVPGGFNPEDIPQLVLLAFDEAVRVEDYNHLYQQVFKRVNAQRRREPRLNPNGCPAVGTFFVSHQFTDYAAVQSLYSEGHEMAAHSISKQLLADYWKTASDAEYSAEFAGQRALFRNLAGIPDGAIRGTRFAYLQGAGDRAISVLQRDGFAWDSSYATARRDPPINPYTLDYRSGLDCPIPPCPVAPHRQYWEVPLVDWLDTNDTLCENVDSCYFPNSREEALQLLRQNFYNHYRQNRAVFTVNLRARWFLNDGYHNMEALQEFLQELEDLGDVYFVTYSQAIEWMQDPVNVRQSAEFFECDYDDRLPLCAHPNLCGYFNITYAPNSEDHPGDRFFQTCAECPEEYPWLGYTGL